MRQGTWGYANSVPRGTVAELDPKKLCKFFKKHAKGTPRLAQRACVLCRPGEEADVDKGVQKLYVSPKNWVLRFDASVEALCPGTKAVTA